MYIKLARLNSLKLVSSVKSFESITLKIDVKSISVNRIIHVDLEKLKQIL